MPGHPLSIALLGPPVIEVDGLPLAVDTRKATALLAYLAVEGRPVRRDTLASLLWPENDPERARSALRRTLSTLRTALGARWLDTGRELVSLGGSGVWIDVDELRSLVASCEGHGHGPSQGCRRCLEPLRAAAALARGPFLAGFGLRDSTEYDDWQQLTGDVVAREVAAVLDRLTDALLAAGDHAAAVTTAQRRLATDAAPRARAPAADRGLCCERRSLGGAQQYRACVRVLDRELGVRPLDETTALYYAVLEGTFAAAPAVEPPPPPAEPEHISPLVGRAADVGALERAYEGVGPDGRLALVLGEAGIGKTRLVRELLDRVREPAVTARCFRGGGRARLRGCEWPSAWPACVRAACHGSRRGGSTRSPACFPSSAVRPSGPSTARRRRSGSTRRSASSSGGYRERCSSTTHTGPTRRRFGCCFSLPGD